MKKFALLLAAFAAFAVHAQEYPSKPVKIVVTYPPGGGMDVTARLLTAPLGERLKQSVIVENKPGASGMIGADYVAKAAPDGYTLVLAPADTHSINPHVYTKMTYDSRRDFVPVAMLGALPMTLLVNPALPVHSVDDLVKLAKERPGKLTFDSWGIGSSSHVAMEVLKQERGIDMLHVPYTGAAPAIAAVAGGQIDAMMASLPTSEPQHVGGKVRIIGVTPIKRAPGQPALPEAGMPPGVAVWVGVLAPAKTPPEIVNRLNREFKAVLDDPQARAALTKAGIEPVASVATPAEFAKFFNESYDFWGRTVKAAKISVEAK